MLASPRLYLVILSNLWFKMKGEGDEVARVSGNRGGFFVSFSLQVPTAQFQWQDSNPGHLGL
jgi:hypothetical protein